MGVVQELSGEGLVEGWVHMLGRSGQHHEGVTTMP